MLETCQKISRHVENIFQGMLKMCQKIQDVLKTVLKMSTHVENVLKVSSDFIKVKYEKKTPLYSIFGEILVQIYTFFCARTCT